MQQRVYKKSICDLAELKQRLVKVWADLEQTIVDEAIDQWRKRLKTCVKAKGQHFEHLLYITLFVCVDYLYQLLLILKPFS